MELSEVEKRIRSGEALHDLVIPSGINYSDLLVISNRIQASVGGILGQVLEELGDQDQAAAINGHIVNGDEAYKGPLDEKMFGLAETIVAKLDVLVAYSCESPTDILLLVEAVAKLREAFYGKSAPLIQLNTQNVGGEGGGRFSGLLKK